MKIENCTYEFYQNTLGRNVIPNSFYDNVTGETVDYFSDLVMKNALFVQNLFDEGLASEKVEYGGEKAVCMMTEEDYKAEVLLTENENAPNASESIGGYSYSKDTKAYDTAIEKSVKSLEVKKLEWLNAFCTVKRGVL